MSKKEKVLTMEEERRLFERGKRPAIEGFPAKRHKPDGPLEMQEKEPVTASRVLVLRHTDAPGDASGIGWLDLDALPTEEDRTRMEAILNRTAEDVEHELNYYPGELKLPQKYFNFENLLPATTNRSDEDLCEFLDKLIVPVTEMKGNLGNIRMVVQLSYEL